MKTGYIFIGASAENTNISIPYPSVGGAAFSAEYLLQSNTNANGVDVSQQVGAARYTQEVSWARISADLWQQVSSFLIAAGSEVYCKFYNHMTGEWITTKFLWSGLHCNPMRVDETTGKPRYYTDAGFSIRSIGEV